MYELLKTKKYKCSVSSVCEKNSSLYGKQYMFDEDESTCWSSDQGDEQWVRLQFDEPVTITSFQIQFQGGFAGKNCVIQTFDSSRHQIDHYEFYPEDSNKLQTFKCDIQNASTNVLFVFRESYDTYGRIIIYKLALFNND